MAGGCRGCRDDTTTAAALYSGHPDNVSQAQCGTYAPPGHGGRPPIALSIGSGQRHFLGALLLRMRVTAHSRMMVIAALTLALPTRAGLRNGVSVPKVNHGNGRFGTGIERPTGTEDIALAMRHIRRLGKIGQCHDGGESRDTLRCPLLGACPTQRNRMIAEPLFRATSHLAYQPTIPGMSRVQCRKLGFALLGPKHHTSSHITKYNGFRYSQQQRRPKDGVVEREGEWRGCRRRG